MAKNKNTETPVVETPVDVIDLSIVPVDNVGLLHIGQLVTIDELNSSRESIKPTPEQLKVTENLMISHPTGWDNGFNIQVIYQLPPDCKVKVDFDEIMAERRKTLADLKTLASAGDVVALKKAEVYSRRYWKDGKQIRPCAITNTANTRSGRFDNVNLVRYEQGKSLIEMVPVEARYFATEQARVLANVRENTVGKKGDIKVSGPGLLASAWAVYKAGYTQTQFRFGKRDEKSKERVDNVFGGEGQKYFYWCEFAADYPALNLLARFLLPDTDPMWLNWGALSHQAMGKAWAERQAGTLTAEKLTAYINEVMNGEPKQRSVSKDKMTSFTREDNLRSRFEYNAVLKGDGDSVSALVRGMKDVDNIIFAEFQIGNYARVKEFMLAYDAACKAGRVNELLNVVQEFNAPVKV